MLVMLCSALTVIAATPDLPRTKVVVLQVRSFDPTTEKKAEELGELALTELGRSGQIEVLGYSDVAAMIGIERQRALLGCDEASTQRCLAEIGGALGAPYLVMGSVGRAGKQLRVDLKLVQSESTRVLVREGQVLDSEEQWYPTVTKMLRTLSSAVPIAEPKAGAAVSKAREQESTGGSSLGPLALVGAGAAGGIAGGLVMLLASGNARDAREAPTAAGVTTRYGDAAGLHGIGTGVLVGGAVLLGAGALWYALTPSAPARPAVAASLLPGGASVSVRGNF